MSFPSLSEIRRARAAKRLLNFVEYTFPGYHAGWVHKAVCAELDKFLEAVVAKKSPRLMLFAPPRHGKSELVSRRFPAYAMGRYPDLSVIATSYSADLSSRLNRDVQRIMDGPEYQEVMESRLFASNVRSVAQGTWLRNSDVFEVVGHRGIYRSAGVGGGITGMGADILIIDDPVKDDTEAGSETIRQNVWDWYTSTAYTRLAPGAGVLLIMTRWHEDDLAGRLLAAQSEGGDQWNVVRFPAIAEHDEEHRKEGDALHPERYSVEMLKQIRGAVGGRVWAALYQQRPSAAEGSIFRREFWRYYKPTSNTDHHQLVRDLGITSVVQTWDTGFKKNAANDPSVGLTLGIAPSRYYVLDVWRGRVEYPELKRTVVTQHAKWKPHVVVVEDMASGQSLIQELKRETRLPILPVRPDRDKVARANAITPQLEAGLVFIPEVADWLADFIDECANFPNGAHDDQVDALTMALNYAVNSASGLGLHEFYRQEAERVAAAKLKDPHAPQRQGSAPSLPS